MSFTEHSESFIRSVCNICEGAGPEVRSGRRQQASDAAKKAGWWVRSNSLSCEDDFHVCPDCRERVAAKGPA